MSTQLATQADAQVANANQGLLAVIERVCTNPEADVNKLEKMLDMQERILDRQAEQAFQDALSELQSELPVIEKNGEIKVNNQVRSRYAKFEDINKSVAPILHKYGFSITFATNQGNGFVTVIGILRHRDGHKESTQLDIPFDASGSKNAVQALGSSVSYGKRYVMSALLNITTTDDDDDGVAAVPSADLFAHNIVLQKHFHTVFQIKQLLGANECREAIDTMKQALTNDEQEALWVATTKGGIFTTEERAKLREPNKFEKVSEDQE